KKPMASTEGHGKLAALAGEWKVVTQTKLSSTMDAVGSYGAAKNTLILDGHYLQSEVTGEGQGRKSAGRPTVADNPAQKKYEWTWIDSKSSAITMGTGALDTPTDSVTFTGAFDDPATGKKTKGSAVLTFKDENKYMIEVHDTGSDGTDFVRVSHTFTRVT